VPLIVFYNKFAAECLSHLLHIPKSGVRVQLLAKKIIVPTGFSAFTYSIKINNMLLIGPLVKQDMAASFAPFLIHLSQFYFGQS
jgi:hypothetical protein